jgi:hypothetical protein
MTSISILIVLIEYFSYFVINGDGIAINQLALLVWVFIRLILQESGLPAAGLPVL